jgi:hypothetical protein
MEPWLVEIVKDPLVSCLRTAADWAVVITAIAAVIAVLVSLWTQRSSWRQYMSTSRPYVWARPFATRDIGPNNVPIITNQPAAIAFLVTNLPARITRQVVHYWFENSGETVEIFNRVTTNTEVQYPAENTQWTYNCLEMANAIQNMGEGVFRRNVRIEYTRLDRHGNFFFENTSTLNRLDGTWRTDEEDGN